MKLLRWLLDWAPQPLVNEAKMYADRAQAEASRADSLAWKCQQTLADVRAEVGKLRS